MLGNMRSQRPILIASAALLGVTVSHILDHARQGRPLPGVLTAVGTLGLAMAGLSLFLAVRKHPASAPAAAFIGLSSVVGLVAVHILPHWSIFSDPYHEVGVDALSWANLALFILAALVLGVLGAKALERRRSGTAT